jgi:hypothetical protein
MRMRFSGNDRRRNCEACFARGSALQEGEALMLSIHTQTQADAIVKLASHVGRGSKKGRR